VVPCTTSVNVTYRVSTKPGLPHITWELIDKRSWPTRAEMHAAVFDYIEGWYNIRRLHSSLSYTNPAEYEALIYHNANRQVALSTSKPVRQSRPTPLTESPNSSFTIGCA